MKYERHSQSVWRFFGEWLPPAAQVKRDPDGPRLVKETIDRAERLLERVKERRAPYHPYHWLYDINQLRTLEWMIEGERGLLNEIIGGRHAN
jgi:hypothetical protein